MAGIIVGRQVFENAGTVIREFGWTVFARCCYAVVFRTGETFLSIISR